MIRTIIVDDDVEVLIGLVNIIDWNDYGFEIVGQAENGTEALDIMKENKNVDLIITDITMPSMDGLELVRYAKERYPHIESIILTCHKEFDYAKEAIELNASDYILKYTLNEEELISVLSRVKGRIENAKQVKSVIQQANKRFDVNKPAIKNKFYKDIIDGRIKQSKLITERASQNSIILPHDKYKAICVQILNEFTLSEAAYIKEVELRRFCMNNILEELLAECSNKDIFWYSSDLQVVTFWDRDILESTNTSVQSILDKYIRKIDELLNISISICVSGEYQGIESIGKAVDEALRLEDQYFYCHKGVIVKKRKMFKEIEAYSLYKKIESELKTALQEQNLIKADKTLKKLFAEIEKEQYASGEIVKLLKMIVIDVESIGKDCNIIFQRPNILPNTFIGWQTMIDNMLGNLADGVSKKKYRKEIVQALAYMNNNLNEAINCELMADKVKMNRSYFSRIFKSEIGMSFTDYLMKIRIDKATMLLKTTDLSNDEISKLIGLENVTYFYKIYRRIKGITPGDVRKGL